MALMKQTVRKSTGGKAPMQEMAHHGTKDSQEERSHHWRCQKASPLQVHSTPVRSVPTGSRKSTEFSLGSPSIGWCAKLFRMDLLFQSPAVVAPQHGQGNKREPGADNLGTPTAEERRRLQIIL